MGNSIKMKLGYFSGLSNIQSSGRDERSCCHHARMTT